MRNFSGVHRLWMGIRVGAALAILLVVWLATPMPFFQYFIGGLLTLLAIAAIASAWSRGERTDIDFVAGSVTRHFWLRNLRKPVVRRLAEFEIVIANWNAHSGQCWISVALSGRNGSFELARFGTDETGARDQADARLLRERLAERLSLRNIGVV